MIDVGSAIGGLGQMIFVSGVLISSGLFYIGLQIKKANKSKVKVD